MNTNNIIGINIGSKKMVGQTILNYKILEKLGEGGMGVVYKAKDIKLDRFAALKFLPLNYIANKEIKERFILEAKITSSLDHPNICTIYEINEYQNSQLFISMAFYDGETLAKKIIDKNISNNDIIDYSIQISQGLQKAHQKGIIHRDIKPANIIINNENLVKILDFGIAKLIQTARITKEYLLPGTAAYMSPEQIIGDEIDHRTDIFSFGIVMYEILTGNHPFKGEYDQAITFSILNDEPLHIHDINPDANYRLIEIVSRCLKKNKSDRFNSFSEIINELQVIKTGSGMLLQNLDYKQEVGFIKNFIPQKKHLFIGREKQIQVLKGFIDSTFDGNGNTLFICGEPGIGKTQLIFNSIKDYSDTVIHILYGRCLSNEGGLPYHPFVSAIKNSTSYQDDRFFNILSKIASANDINITNRIPLIRSFINLSADYSKTLFHKEQLWDAIFVLIKLLACSKPLLIILDDIQWTDKATLELISYISRNISNLPILIIGVYRPYETINDDSQFLIDTIRNLRIENLAVKIELERLSEKETYKIIAEELGSKNIDKKLSRKIYRQSEGNPLFINELITFMKDKGFIKFSNDYWRLELEDEKGIVTERVQDVIRQRVDQLDNQTREILEIASCEGEYFQSDVISGCLNIRRIDLLRKLQILEKERYIIRHERDSYRFDHILIRDVLYESILPELRAEFHRIISLWLIEKYRDKDEYASRIAYHLIAAGEEEKSIDYLLTAAGRERDFYAVEEAMNHYSILSKILKKGNANNNYNLLIEEGLGDIKSSIGKSEEAIKHYEHYLALARVMKKENRIVNALHKLSECFRTKGELNKAENLCNEAIDLAVKIDDKRELLESLNTLAFINASRGNYNKTLEISNQAISLSDKTNDLKNKSISLSNLGFANWHLGNYPAAMENFSEALSIQRSIGDSLGLSISLNYLGLVHWKLGKYEQALNASFESVKIKKSIADYRTVPGSLNGIGDIYRDIGDYAKAASCHKQSLSLAREHQNKGGMCDNLRDLGEDYLLLGDQKQALKYYQEALEVATLYNIKWYETRSYLSLSELFLLQGNKEEANMYLNKGIENSFRLNARDLIIEALWKQSHIKAEQGMFNQCISMLEEAISLAAEIGHNTFLWKLYFNLGKILIRMKNFEKAKEAINSSYTIVQDIAKEFSDMELKKTYLESTIIRELFTTRDDLIKNRSIDDSSILT